MNFAAQDHESLIAGCIKGTNSSLREFVHTFQPVIVSTVVKTSSRYGISTPDTVDDLIQEVYVKLFEDNCRILRRFQIRDQNGIFGFVQAVAYSTVHDHFRHIAARKRGGEAAPASFEFAEGLCGQDPTREYQYNLLLERIDSLIGELVAPPNTERDREIFWLYYREGLTAKAIGELSSIALNAKAVESVLHRLTVELRIRLAARDATADPQKDSGPFLRYTKGAVL